MRVWLTLLTGIVAGAVIWWLSPLLTGYQEPFDSPSYYYLIAMFIAGSLATIPAPRYWWLAVIGIFIGERLYAYLMLPEIREWVWFGIVMNILGLLWLPALLGSLTTYVIFRTGKRFN